MLLKGRQHELCMLMNGIEVEVVRIVGNIGGSHGFGQERRLVFFERCVSRSVC